MGSYVIGTAAPSSQWHTDPNPSALFYDGYGEDGAHWMGRLDYDDATETYTFIGSMFDEDETGIISSEIRFGFYPCTGKDTFYVWDVQATWGEGLTASTGVFRGLLQPHVHITKPFRGYAQFIEGVHDMVQALVAHHTDNPETGCSKMEQLSFAAYDGLAGQYADRTLEAMAQAGIADRLEMDVMTKIAFMAAPGWLPYMFDLVDDAPFHFMRDAREEFCELSQELAEQMNFPNDGNLLVDVCLS